MRLRPRLALLAMAAATAVHAQSPFGVTVVSPTLPTLSVGYASFPDLLSAVLNAKQQFAAYGQLDYSAAFTFLGVPNAILASSNASTARMANTSFSRFGFTPLADAQSASGPASGTSTVTGNGRPGLSSFGIGLNGTNFRAWSAGLTSAWAF